MAATSLSTKRAGAFVGRRVGVLIGSASLRCPEPKVIAPMRALFKQLGDDCSRPAGIRLCPGFRTKRICRPADDVR